MKSKEVRIGNFIKRAEHKNWQERYWNDTVEVGYNEMYLLSLDEWSEWYNPIELDEKWMLNFGLKKDHNNRYVTHNWTGLCFEFKSQWYCYRYTNIGIIEITFGFKYVHDFQNLYYALTKVELMCVGF